MSLLFLVNIPSVTASDYLDFQSSIVCSKNNRNKECSLVNKWFSQGTAAGNIGDFYDNRDRGHSGLKASNYPQLSVITYTEEEKKKRMDWGGQIKILPHVTIGNSSTATSVLNGGSQTRSMYYTSPQGLAFLYAQYRNNNLYVYPEHRDHDIGHNGRLGFGDLYPTNTPYLVTSQGSSGSDQVFLNAFIITMAAFNPEVKKRMIKNGLLMPTLQMLFRSNNKNIMNTQEYLTGKAHPTVFKGSLIDYHKMVQQAHKIKTNDIPPMVQLMVTKEDQAVNGIDYFEENASEKLGDTPAVIARIFRRSANKKTLIVSAESSFDINNRPLTYYWEILRGDPERVKIYTKNNGTTARLVISYHERRPIFKGSEMESNRVDIGVFVHNGAWYSAPGFITIFFLDNEARTYDAQGRLLAINYAATDTSIGHKTTKPQEFINNSKYPISDWNRLFDSILSNSNKLPTILFKERLTDCQTKAIARAAASFKLISLRLVQINSELKAVNLNQKENEEQLKLEKQKLQKEKNALFNKSKALFLDTEECLQTNIKDFIEILLNSLLNDSHLYINHQQAIHILMENTSQERQERIIDARNKLIHYGILKSDNTKRFKLHSILPTHTNQPQALTTDEKNLISEFTQVLMNQLLFPDILFCKTSVNFVDPRLTSNKLWRDVYQYDNNGIITGWHRYDGVSITEYTSNGQIIIKKSEDGRVLKDQEVTYILDKKQKTLKVIPAE